MSPTRKVTAAGLGAGVAACVVGIAVWLGAPDPPLGLEGAISTVAGFLAGYFTDD